jgi:cyclic beta-1,2-glucan synthetase
VGSVAPGATLSAIPRRRLSGEPWGDHEPIRAELFSDEQLQLHAVTLADSQVVIGNSTPVVSLLTRIEQDQRALVRCYEAIVGDIQADRAITPAAEWLVDNFHAVEEQIRQVRKDLPRGYFNQLPKLGPGFLEGHPRIFGIMWAYVAHTDSALDPDQLGRYIRAHETRKALTLGELWAAPINLRIVLIENVRRVSEQVVAAAQLRAAADQVADRLLGIDGSPPQTHSEVLGEVAGFRPERAFAVQLLRRLTEEPAEETMAWLRGELLAQGVDPEEAIQEVHQAQARATLTMRNIFGSLRLLNDVNWEDWLESVSLIEAELRANAGYPELDFTTRNLYRTAIERLARGSGQDEIDVTRAALRLAATAPDDLGQDLGFWLLDDGQEQFERSLGYRSPPRERRARAIRRAGLPGYLAAVVVLTGLLVALSLWLVVGLAGDLRTGWVVLLGGLAAIPAADFALGLINFRVTRVLHASFLPALALREGVPEELRTLVVVPTMLTSQEGIEELIDGLEVHFLANDSGEIYFSAVTDWADSPTEHRDDDQSLLESAQSGIRGLNARYGDRFFLFHRERRFNPGEGVWMGWERKRGKLDELNVLLRGGNDTSYTTIEGRLPGPFRYVITLDSDTVLPRASAKKLVAKLAHPLNRARFDPHSGRVTRGYSILAPRVTPSLPPLEDSSVFQTVYSTRQGLDPYAFTVSDVYQDLFGEGSFAGKGIYEIDALTAALLDRIPENTVLSHDLLEGNYARSGLVTDVEVVEEHPTSYEVAASRTHRWTRGDWQLLPWILRRHQGLPRLGLWKMVDNLRRSLTPVALVVGFLVALAVLPADAAWLWLGLVAAFFLLPPLMPLAPDILLRRQDVTKRSQAQSLAGDIAQGLTLGTLNLAFLSHQAAMMVDAIARTLWRMVVTHKHMLEWTTAAAAQQQAKGTVERFVRVMALGYVAPVAALAIAATRDLGLVAVAAVPAVLWLGAPIIAQRVSRHYEPVEVAASTDELDYLRAIGRRTWSFFETFVTAEENHLPPDNFQEDPHPVVAHRTSPTNIGLYLLATASARDFGWIGLADAVDRFEATLRTVAALDHHRGHLLNWYDTRTREPLHPRYVSSVDSGNLAGHLLALANTCTQWVEHPDVGRDDHRGIADGVALIHQSMEDLDPQSITGAQRSAMSAGLAAVDAALGAAEPRRDAAQRLAAVGTALARLAEITPGESEVGAWVTETRRSVDSLQRDAALTEEELLAISARLTRVGDQARQDFDAMDFAFLLDPRRELLAVGFQVDQGALDKDCYDLLASECRLASFVAIAKGDIPTRHWTRLGRTVTAAGGGAALLSWSGSMFEYLMPPLVMRTPSTSLLSSTSRRIVRRQIDYAAGRGVPWGISESGFNARDPELNYQYSPFGAPGLGIVRGLADNLVIAPYATGLASMVMPAEAAANYRRLAALGARGRFGYFEAIDYTRARLRADQEFAIVRSFMAHHQGMTIVAIHDVMHDGLMRNRFHTEPIVRATELLLQERAPRDIPLTHARTEERRPPPPSRTVVTPAERTLTGATATAPGLHLMSNGRLTMSLTPAGGGQLTWNGIAITRWHPDLTTDDTGDYIYLQEHRNEHVWSAAAVPVRTTPDDYEVRFAEDRARYSRRDGHLQTTVGHRLSPESDAVVRTVSVRNDSRSTRRITITSYAELVLAEARGDDAHPAFSKLFVHTEYLPDSATIVATRRRRSPADPEVWAAHFVVAGADASSGGGAVGAPVPETDRLAFLGRNRTTRSPRRLDPGVPRSGNLGHVLDPIFSLSQEITVPPDDEVTLHYWTVAAGTRDDVLRLVDQHRASGAPERVAMLSWTQSQIQLRHLGISAREAGRFQSLAGHVMFPERSMRAPERALGEAGPQSALWPLGISGDLPILVVRIDDPADLALVHQVVKAFEFWRLKRFAVDVVLLNERSTSYVQELHQALLALAGGGVAGSEAQDAAGRIFVVRRDQADPLSAAALIAAAAVVLVARRGDLTAQLAWPAPAGLPPTSRNVRQRTLGTPAMDRAESLVHFNGMGGFSQEGNEYVTVLDGDRSTPGPWTNVVANEQFGFHATAEGAGYTWWRNSRDNQITPWRNDPVCTPVSEAIYVRDDDTGRIGSPTASPVRGGGHHVARHGFGYTRYTHDMDGIELDQTVFVAPDDPVKLTLLTVTNRTGRRRSLTVTAYAELVLGADRTLTSRHILTDVDEETTALLARNPWSTEYPDQVAFLDLAGRQESWTGDRREFLGLNGTAERPQAIVDGHPLSGAVGPGRDPCAAQQLRIVLEPGAHADVLVVLGAGHDLAEVRVLVARYREINPHHLLDDVRRRWQQRVSTVRVTTPSSAFDVMMNGWLLYQTLACRMLARSGYYQASGAYGFRDQLQDSMTVALVEPELARTHLLRAAGRQFLEGDVQHWWLPASGRGVRTRISDDVVWLAHALCRYVQVTGDVAILDERVPFLEGAVLGEDQGESFFQPSTSTRSASLYDHCVIALEHAFSYGRHGLPLIGTGDWNDGMNRVGAGGEGESVWLGWFLHATLTDFGALARAHGDLGFADRCSQEQATLLTALEEHGWDGAWYRRGYFDDGTPLGSSVRAECRIDGIAQSWAVLSGAADPQRATQAMEQADDQLVMLDEGIVRLFTPPFDTSEPDPGYIRAYPPGARENGGQYTHGALWSVFAWAALGREDRAAASFELINPVNHALTPEAAERYRVEPYVVAADVFSEPPHVGRGGWTWYTGSAGWMYRAGLEAILGLKRQAGDLVIDPCLPPQWHQAGITYRFGTTTYDIAIEADCHAPRQVARVIVDGVDLPDARLPLVDDGGIHQVRVEMESRSDADPGAPQDEAGSGTLRRVITDHLPPR